MGTMALLIFILLSVVNRQPKGLATSATAAQDAAAAALKLAAAAAAKAAQTGNPAHAATAAAAADHAAAAVQRASNAASASNNAPPQWPQVIPKGLPSWPNGWKPMSPVPGAVSARAWALLPGLWKSGAGTHKTEQTAGQWVTYQATNMGNGIKGITAWTPKPGIVVTPASANA